MSNPTHATRTEIETLTASITASLAHANASIEAAQAKADILTAWLDDIAREEAQNAAVREYDTMMLDSEIGAHRSAYGC